MSGGLSDTLLSGVDRVTLATLSPEYLGEGLSTEVFIKGEYCEIWWTYYLDDRSTVRQVFKLHGDVCQWFDRTGTPVEAFWSYMRPEVQQFKLNIDEEKKRCASTTSPSV